MVWAIIIVGLPLDRLGFLQRINHLVDIVAVNFYHVPPEGLKLDI